MAFDPKYYIPASQYAAYDGTNSADIVAYPWTDPITLVSEEDGVLTLDGVYGQFTVNTGDIVVVDPSGQFGGSIAAADLDRMIHIEPVE